MKLCVPCGGSGKRSRGGGDCHPCRGSGIALTWISPSQINTFDDTREGCNKKWWYQRIGRIETPQTEAAARGSAGHKALEQYYRGAALTDRLAIKALPLLPSRDPALLIEAPIHVLRNERFGYYGLTDLTDPREGAVIHDYKFSGNPKRWGLTEQTIKTDVAANVYSMGWLDRFKLDYISLQWTYIPTKGGQPYPIKQTLSRRHVEAECVKIDKVCEQIVLARSAKVADLAGNPATCSAFSGCPFIPVCDTPKRSFSASFAKGKTEMSNVDPAVLARLQAMAGTAAPSAAPASPAPAPAAGVPPVQTNAEILQAKLAQLGAAAAAPASPAPAPAAGVPPVQTQAEALQAKLAQLGAAAAAPASPAPAPAAGAVDPALAAKIAALKAAASGAVAPAPVAAAAPIAAPVATPGADVPSAGYTLYIDCLPQGEIITAAADLIEHANKTVCTENGVSHWRCFDFKASGAISAALAPLLAAGAAGNAVFATSRETEIDSLVWYAARVVRGMR